MRWPSAVTHAPQRLLILSFLAQAVLSVDARAASGLTAQLSSRSGRARQTAFLSRAETRSHTKFPFSMYDKIITAPRCTCECCIVESRRPSENDGHVTTKCSVPPSNSDGKSCPEKCSVVSDPIFSAFDVVGQDRFCFYSCIPSTSLPPPKKVEKDNALDASFKGGYLPNSPCVDATSDAKELAKASDGNGRDPHYVPLGF